MTVSGGSASAAVAGLVTVDGHVVDVRVLQPVKIIAIRAGRVYLQTFSGLLAAGVTTKALPAADFLHLVYLCAGLSVASAGVSLVQNTLELFNKLDQKYPQLTA